MKLMIRDDIKKVKEDFNYSDCIDISELCDTALALWDVVEAAEKACDNYFKGDMPNDTFCEMNDLRLSIAKARGQQ